MTREEARTAAIQNLLAAAADESIEVYNVDFKDWKDHANRAFYEAYRDIDMGEGTERDRNIRYAISYSVTTFPSKKLLKLIETAQPSKTVDAVNALITEWKPVSDAIKTIKPRVIMGRKPNPNAKPKDEIPTLNGDTTELERIITEGFAPARDELRDSYIGQIKRLWTAFYNEDGTEKERIRSTDTRYNTFREVRRYAQSIDGSCFPNAPQRLNEDYLIKCAERYADDAFAGWIIKCVGKLGHKATNVETGYVYNAGGEFTMIADVEGSKVVLTQTIVLKCSNRGNLFHQFPARYRVDGKASTEKKFKERFYG